LPVNLVSYDRPGYGVSSSLATAASLESQVQALGAILGVERQSILVGHSYGAAIALQAALTYTDKVGGVVLVGGSINPALEKRYWFQLIGDWWPIAWLLPSEIRTCNRELLTLQADLLALKPKIRDLAVPVVTVHGGKDHLVPVANVQYLETQLRAAGKEHLLTSRTYPEFNHFIPWEHPDVVNAAIQELVQSLPDLRLAAGSRKEQ
jgi:pimeloyl-ACP methyl ester carboxylesterase